jgi:hypothetical protein
VITKEQIAAAVEAQFRNVVRQAVGSLTEEQRARWFGVLAPVQRFVHGVVTITVEELLGIGPANRTGRPDKPGGSP